MAGFSPVIGNRVNLDLYANLRPVKLYPGVRHRIHGQPPPSIWLSGFLFFSENSGERGPNDVSVVASVVAPLVGRVDMRSVMPQLVRNPRVLARFVAAPGQEHWRCPCSGKKM